MLGLLWLPMAVEAQERSSGTLSAEEQVALVEELSAAGTEKYLEKKYEEALSLFKQALAVQPVTNLLFNVGLTCERLGREDEAIRYYERFIGSPDVPEGGAQKAREKLRGLRAQRLARQEEARALRESNAIAVSVQAGSSDDDMALWGWTAIGTGAAMLAVGATFAVLAGNEQDAFDGSESLAEKRAFDSNGTSLALAADIGFGLGAAAVTTGTVLLILDAMSTSDGGSSATYLGPMISPQAFGLCAGARF